LGALAKGATLVAELLEGGKYTIGLRMEEFAHSISFNNLDFKGLKIDIIGKIEAFYLIFF